MSLVSLVVSQVSHHQVERRRNTRKKYGAAVWKTTKKRLQRQMLLLPCEKIRLKNLHFLESHLPEASGRERRETYLERSTYWWRSGRRGISASESSA